MTLGERICQERVAHHLSQMDLAERLEVSRQSVSKWETNVSIPDLDKIVKMCELFEVSMDSLVRGVPPCESQDEALMIELPRVKRKPGVPIILGLMLIFFGLLIFVVRAFFMRVGSIALEDALILSAPLLVTGGTVLKFPEHPLLAASWGLWGLYTVILFPFLFWATRESLIFLLGGLVILGILVVSTWKVRSKKE